MADVILKDRDGNSVEYTGITGVRLETPDGGTVLFENKEPGSGDGGGIDESKPIRFYDPHGDILYTYTLEEIQALEELPPGPTLSGVTFDAWTHTLEELKAIPYFADVGPMYKYGTTPVNVYIIETTFNSTTITLTHQATTTGYNATIRWGDGSTSTLTGSSTSSGVKSLSHTYTTAGEYVIAVVPTGTYFPYVGATDNSYCRNLLGNTINQSTTSTSYLDPTTTRGLKSVICGNKTTFCIKNLVGNSTLRFVSLGGATSTGWAIGTKAFLCNPALEVIAGKTSLYLDSAYDFFCQPSLKRIWIQCTVDTAFMCCDGIKELQCGRGNFVKSTMNSKYALLMNPETPPSITATNPKWGTYPIYVPDSAVEAYKAADGWSNAADYIFPASQYHER